MVLSLWRRAFTWSAVADDGIDEPVHVDRRRRGSCRSRRPSARSRRGTRCSRRRRTCRSSTTRSQSPNVGICALELPQTTSSRSGSICRIALAVFAASCAYSSAVPWPSCHGPSISLPRHHIRMSWGSACAVRDAPVGPMGARAQVRVLEDVECLLDPRGSRGSRRTSARCRPSSASWRTRRARSRWSPVECHARSSRRGRASRGPTPSSQRYPDTKLPPG